MDIVRAPLTNCLRLDEKFHFLKAGKRVLDLGAAPGGWTQVAVDVTRSTQEDCRVLAVDILPMDAVTGAICLQLDFLKDEAPDVIRPYFPQGADIVLSDMAPNTMGHTATDHLRIMALLELAYPFACEVLRPGGTFIAKVFQGGAESEFLKQMKKDFTQVKHAKPKASRAGSSEVYVVATGFRSRAK